jgi:hypothetical protein
VHSACAEWEPLFCIGGGGPLFPSSKCEMPTWEPICSVMGGGGPQIHPSGSLGQFNDKERILSARHVIKSLFQVGQRT